MNQADLLEVERRLPAEVMVEEAGCEEEEGRQREDQSVGLAPRPEKEKN